MNETINITQLSKDATSSLTSQLTESDHLIIESDYEYHHAQLDDLLDLMIHALIKTEHQQFKQAKVINMNTFLNNINH